MSFEVRHCADVEEFIDAFDAIGQYFGAEPTEERLKRFLENLPLDRMLGAREDGRVVGGAGAFAFEMTVPGAFVPTAGITLVGVSPTHRRRGVLRAMMKKQLEDLHERGEPVAALWASEETIYGRFGYGMASLTGEITVPKEHNAYALRHERVGRIRFVEGDERLEVLPRVWDSVRPVTPGMLSRPRAWWEQRVLADPPDRRDGGGPKRFVVVELDGEPRGYAIYRHNPKFEEGVSVAKLFVVEAVAEDGAATADLWRYLLDIDWSATVSAWLLPVDHPLWFLLATPRRMRFKAIDGLWVRLVDVGAALSARKYALDGAVVFDVFDAFCPWNEGRWLLEAGEARRTDAEADLRCDVSALGSAYLGGFSWSQLVRGGRVEELRPGAAAEADAMFRADRAPWCPEIF